MIAIVVIHAVDHRVLPGQRSSLVLMAGDKAKKAVGHAQAYALANAGVSLHLFSMSAPEHDSISPVLSPSLSNRLAVFIDIENFAGYCADMDVPVDITPVLDHLSKHHGRIQIKRSFGDVSSLPAPMFNPYRIRRMLQAYQVDHIDIPHRPSSYSKNSADIRLVVEAVSLIHQRPNITHIVVVSNDRDFIPLFNHAREHGKLVIGCGPGRSNVNEIYRRACDVFLFHEDWVGTKPADGSAATAVLTAATSLAPSAVPIGSPTAVMAPDQPDQTVVSTNTTLAASPFSTVLSGDTASYFAQRVATELPEHQQGISPERSITASVPDNDPTECLLAAMRSLQAKGATLVASRVAARLKMLFPGLDVKQMSGSFKQFCIEQAKSGRIDLHNLEQPNFTIALAQEPLTEQAVVETASPAPLLAKYQDWSYRKLKIPFPTPAVRARLYEILVQVLDESLNRADFISLQELSRLCGIALGAVTARADDVAFRLCYGLFRGKAFKFYKTESSFNPDIIGLAVDPFELDGCFAHNTRAGFIHDNHHHGLPLDEEVLAKLMQGYASTLVVSAAEQPELESRNEAAPGVILEVTPDTPTDHQADAQGPSNILGDPISSAPPESEVLKAAQTLDQSTASEHDVPIPTELAQLAAMLPTREPEFKPASPLPISAQPRVKPKLQKKSSKGQTVAAGDPSMAELTEQLLLTPVSSPKEKPQTAPKPKRSTVRQKADPVAERDSSSTED